MELADRVVLNWRRDPGGYGIHEAPAGAWLVWWTGDEEDLFLPAEGGPPLHRRFSSLFAYQGEEALGAVQAFADEFGMLGIWERVPVTVHDAEGEQPWAERVDSWISESLDLRLAMSSWEAAESGTLKEMNERLSWWHKTASASLGSRVGLTESGGEVWANLLPRSSAERFDSKELASRRLRQLVVARVTDQFGGRRRSLHPETESFDPAVLRRPVLYGDRVEMRDQARSLLGLIWLEFAYSLDIERVEKRCLVCNDVFIVDNRRKTRRSREYCSEKCRMAAYRERKREAVKLAQRGMTPAKIAKKLDSDTKTVQGWLKGKNRRTK
ncbi:MAG: hypothetical protein AAF430_22025 [Myxococcota bacterium]